jgi:cardiolipin synthase
VIANAYFFPGIRIRRALIAPRSGSASRYSAGTNRICAHSIRVARALRSAAAAGIGIQEYHQSFLHAKVAVVDGTRSTVGSSNIDPYAC